MSVCVFICIYLFVLVCLCLFIEEYLSRDERELIFNSFLSGETFPSPFNLRGIHILLMRSILFNISPSNPGAACITAILRGEETTKNKKCVAAISQTFSPFLRPPSMSLFICLFIYLIYLFFYSLFLSFSTRPFSFRLSGNYLSSYFAVFFTSISLILCLLLLLTSLLNSSPPNETRNPKP